MSNYYHQFLSSMSGFGGIPGTSPHDVHPPPFPGAHLPMTGPVAPSPQGYGYFSGYPEPAMYNPNSSKSQKNRRKGTGLDQVKHRRTRSGCFTCRSRRVKCDEARPVCDRCRKGSRDCIYPDPAPAKGTSSQSSASKDTSGTVQQPSPISSYEGEEHEELERDVKLDTIPDEDEDEDEASGLESLKPSDPGPSRVSSSGFSPQAHSGIQNARRMSEASSQDENKSSPSTSTETSTSLTAAAPRVSPDHPSLSSKLAVDWSKFSPDVQRYMEYFLQDMTHFHYGIIHDGHDFFHSIFPNFVARNEALLNAVVGFAAYHYNLERNPNGKIQEFLQYYNRGVTLLLAALKRRESPDVSTLLTILQLAAIEEYLGDWINLMGHQKAAFEILTKLFTPTSAVQSPLGRMAVLWYARFDVWVATQGGFPTALPEEWLTEMMSFCQSRAAEVKGDPIMEYTWTMESQMAEFLAISRAMSMLYARRSRDQITPQDYAAEHARLLRVLNDWRAGWGPLILDPAYRITEFDHGPAKAYGGIIDPHAPPEHLYGAPKLATTGLEMHWLSICIMLKLQAPPGSGRSLWAELPGHGYEVCRAFEQLERLERLPDSPGGCVLFLHSPLTICAVVMPHDENHHQWFRRKFAFLESRGFIYPTTVRSNLAGLFRDPSFEDWWLPNGEGQSSILRAARNLADERNAVAINSQQENLREIRHVFAKLDLGG